MNTFMEKMNAYYNTFFISGMYNKPFFVWKSTQDDLH